MTPEPISDSRARNYWKWLRRAFLAVSLVTVITFALTTNPIPTARQAAVERGHDPDHLTLREFDNANRRWFGGATTVRLRSQDAKGNKDIDVVLKRPPWLFGWQVEDYAERDAGK